MPLMSFRRRECGATMLEMIVTLTIVGILLAIAMPQMGDWIKRNSVTSAAEVIQNGLRQAEAEAIRRNLRVEFLLTEAQPGRSGIRSLASVANGKNWAIRALDTSYAPLSDEGLAYVNAFAMKDISNDVAVSGPASVVFGGNGRVTGITGVAVTESQVFRLSRTGVSKAVCVFVTQGGAIKSCDPSLESGEPFACQPLLSASRCPAN